MDSTSQYCKLLSTFEFWLELAWLGAKCKGKTLLVIEIFFTQQCTVTVQYCCSVSKEKHDQVFSAALLNGRKIQISLQLPDPDLTWRVASTAHWTLTNFKLHMNRQKISYEKLANGTPFLICNSYVVFVQNLTYVCIFFSFFCNK